VSESARFSSKAMKYDEKLWADCGKVFRQTIATMQWHAQHLHVLPFLHIFTFSARGERVSLLLLSHVQKDKKGSMLISVFAGSACFLSDFIY
jgi:hypothetical protein